MMYIAQYGISLTFQAFQGTGTARVGASLLPMGNESKYYLNDCIIAPTAEPPA